MQSAWEAIVAQISAQGKAQRAGEVGPFPARMDTIQRRGKQRVRRSRTALVVEFEDVEGRSWSGVFLALQKDRDWRVEGWSGGRSDFGLKRPNVKEPRANLGGGGHYLGGRVYGPVVSVLATDRRGQIARDAVDEGWAILIWDENLKTPCEIQLRGADGALVRQQHWPFDHSLSSANSRRSESQ
jgi:hypothetical protein